MKQGIIASHGRALGIALLLIAVWALIGCGDGNTLTGRPETGYGTGGDSVGFRDAGKEHETTETRVPGGA